jgi:hypothetical protein
VEVTIPEQKVSGRSENFVRIRCFLSTANFVTLFNIGVLFNDLNILFSNDFCSESSLQQEKFRPA